jgi:hypothetical protein
VQELPEADIPRPAKANTGETEKGTTQAQTKASVPGVRSDNSKGIGVPIVPFL